MIDFNCDEYGEKGKVDEGEVDESEVEVKEVEKEKEDLQLLLDQANFQASKLFSGNYDSVCVRQGSGHKSHGHILSPNIRLVVVCPSLKLLFLQ